jgi:hypothetical protein
VLGHGGDLNYFHSDMHLVLDKGLGFFVSYNSTGRANSIPVLRCGRNFSIDISPFRRLRKWRKSSRSVLSQANISPAGAATPMVLEEMWTDPGRRFARIADSPHAVCATTKLPGWHHHKLRLPHLSWFSKGVHSSTDS